jgi:hypothetical protein
LADLTHKEEDEEEVGEEEGEEEADKGGDDEERAAAGDGEAHVRMPSGMAARGGEARGEETDSPGGGTYVCDSSDGLHRHRIDDVGLGYPAGAAEVAPQVALVSRLL